MEINKFKITVAFLALVLVGLAGYYAFLVAFPGSLSAPGGSAPSSDKGLPEAAVPKEIQQLPDYEPGNPRVSNLPDNLKKSGEVAKVSQVDISSEGFNPSSVSVNVGDIVTFTNTDTQPHQVYGEGDLWFSRVLNSEESFSQEFDVPGTYSYYDKLNPDLKGAVVVQ